MSATPDTIQTLPYLQRIVIGNLWVRRSLRGWKKDATIFKFLKAASYAKKGQAPQPAYRRQIARQVGIAYRDNRPYRRSLLVLMDILDTANTTDWSKLLLDQVKETYEIFAIQAERVKNFYEIPENKRHIYQQLIEAMVELEIQAQQEDITKVTLYPENPEQCLPPLTQRPTLQNPENV